jgi:hypothetical protein
MGDLQRLKTNHDVKLVRFAHNWKNGMLELWNDGFKEKIKAHIFALIV